MAYKKKKQINFIKKIKFCRSFDGLASNLTTTLNPVNKSRDVIRFFLERIFEISIGSKIKAKTMSFGRLTLRDQIFFGINFFLCGLARITIKTLPLRYFATYFGQFYQSNQFSTLPTFTQLQRAIWIGKSVRLAAKYTPWDSSCLTQAMIGKFWCRFYHIPYVFYIGFAKDSDLFGQYKAHAWITVGAAHITGGNGWANFRVVSTYARFY